MHVIAHIHTDFKEKFGIPRQSGLACGTVGYIVFDKPYRTPEALRGMEGYSHLWLLWQFSESIQDAWRPTVRPPRLGGNRRMGVFATRSPFRPNPIGLSSVRLREVRATERYGTVLIVEGADLLDGTPIYDIKPYLPFTDSHPEATYGFAEAVEDYRLSVDVPSDLRPLLGENEAVVRELLANDPRPSYQDDATRVYFMTYASLSVAFRVEEDTVHVVSVTSLHGATHTNAPKDALEGR